MITMTPSRPYVLQAFYDWIIDNQLTPHLIVNVEVPHVKVPLQFAHDGKIILNIAPQAVGQLQMDKDAVSFSARFGGQSQQVYLPMASIMAIHAKENGVGTEFPPEPALEAWTDNPTQSTHPTTKKSTLSLVD